MSNRLSFGELDFELTFEWDADNAVRLGAVSIGSQKHELHAVPAVEILTADMGHVPASSRIAHTQLGCELRYLDHQVSEVGELRTLVIRQAGAGLQAELRLTWRQGAASVSSQVTVTNVGQRPVVLRGVTSWSAGFTPAPVIGDALIGWDRITGVSDWLGEGRWTRSALRGPDFPSLEEALTGHNPRGALKLVSNGTWSTGHALPVGALESSSAGLCVAWQLEHNGAWSAEIGEDTDGGYVSLSGPTDGDSAWTKVLAPGATFETVPATIAWATDLDSAISALTAHRRLARRPHPDNTAMPVIFNDYMNTLNGDPTTEKLLPLIAAAADAGAEVFCIDAGWYDDSGHWWDTVGEWQPSTTRFPRGLGEVIAAIQAAGMVPGLWLEPEVIGIHSPVADSLPAEAFLQRHGVRLVEHHRFHLDLRHPAAIGHLDTVIDRLAAELGIGFFKFDYNINPGSGTDVDSDSPGDGLLQHNRAHLAWLDGLLDRHPELVIENCASGAMRMDFALLSRLAMQSTSDQQDFTKYPPTAASAPMSMLPEQAASWAYPQPEMSDEEISFCMVTGLLGRFYVSGYLSHMTDPQRTRVATAIGVAKSLRADIRTADPFWPLGLPGWDDDWVSLGLRGEGVDHVSIWRRGPGQDVVLHLPHRVGDDLDVTTIFPADLPEWTSTWDAQTGTLTVRAVPTEGVAARTLRLTARPHRPASRPALPASLNRSE